MKALKGTIFSAGLKIRETICNVRLQSTETLTQCEDDGFGIRTLILNNPKKRNALSFDMLKSIEGNLVKDNSGLKVIIIKANGPVFSSGHDLKELSKDRPSDYHEKVFNLCSKVMMMLRNIPVPVIAQAQGLATAAGCQLVASCDISVAGKSATFATPGVNGGLFCTTPGVAIGRAVPKKAALYMLFTGLPITAQEALQFGLISKVVDDELLEKEVRKIGEKIARLSKPVIRLGKKAFNEQMELNLDNAYRLASQTMVDNLKFEDAQEGIDAFINKRQPVWKY